MARPQDRGDNSEQRDGVTFCLQAHDVLSILSDYGIGIQCKSGTIWVTQDCDLCDHILSDNETFFFDTRGRVVIEAVTDALVTLQARITISILKKRRGMK